jgi:hypothetical protein
MSQRGIKCRRFAKLVAAQDPRPSAELADGWRWPVMKHFAHPVIQTVRSGRTAS